MNGDLPAEVRANLERAKRLAWWTLFWMSSVCVVMWLAMGSSQAMKTALVEDLLSLSGSLDRESAREMREAIEEHCERIEPRE